VFTSPETYGAAKQWSGYGSTGHRLNVILLDLDRAFATRRSDEPEAVRPIHPFLQSIIEQLEDRHLDVVHVVARCVPYGNRCALSFPRPQELSSDERWSEEVTAEELDSFLIQVGAQACILSGARAHVSLYRLRSFAEELAKYTPRRVLVQELPEESAWASIWDPAHGPSASMAQWVAPTVLSDSRDRLWHDVLDRLTWERRHDEMLDGRAPRWVYGAQRILERLAAESIEMAMDQQFAEDRELGPVDSEVLLSAFQNAKMLLYYCSKQPEFRGSDEAIADLIRLLEGELGHSGDVRIWVAY
jgi:hypothetical protein